MAVESDVLAVLDLASFSKGLSRAGVSSPLSGAGCVGSTWASLLGCWLIMASDMGLKPAGPGAKAGSSMLPLSASSRRAFLTPDCKSRGRMGQAVDKTLNDDSCKGMNCPPQAGHGLSLA